MKDEKIKAMQGEIALAHGVFQQPAKGLFGAVFCIVIGAVLAVLISTYGKRFV